MAFKVIYFFVSVMACLQFIIALDVKNCWPKKFRTRLGLYAGMPVGGVLGVYEQEVILEMDEEEKRWAITYRDYYVTGDLFELIYAEDYNTGTYSIGTHKGCATVPMTKKKKIKAPCLPDDAIKLREEIYSDGPAELYYAIVSFSHVHSDYEDSVVNIRIHSAVEVDEVEDKSASDWAARSWESKECGFENMSPPDKNFEDIFTTKDKICKVDEEVFYADDEDFEFDEEYDDGGFEYLPMSEIGWWTAKNFNHTVYIGFLDPRGRYGVKRNESIFNSLEKYYNCQRYETLPASFDTSPTLQNEVEYIMQRILVPE